MSTVEVPRIEPVSMNRRFVAYMLDGIVLTVASVFLFIGPFSSVSATTADGVLARSLAIALVSLAYFAWGWTQLGASLGQRALGVRTLNAADGAILTPTQAVWRWVYLYGVQSLLWAVSALPNASASDCWRCSTSSISTGRRRRTRSVADSTTRKAGRSSCARLRETRRT